MTDMEAESYDIAPDARHRFGGWGAIQRPQRARCATTAARPWRATGGSMRTSWRCWCSHDRWKASSMKPVPGSLLVRGIGQLVTNRPELGSGSLGMMRDVDLVVENGVVAWIGATGMSPAADSVLEADGRCVIPGFVDSHTHLVFSGDRSEEFAARMAGERYVAGGIFATVAATRSAPSSSLLQRATKLAKEAESQGTTTLETKSGYGLTVIDESRLPRGRRGGRGGGHLPRRPCRRS